MPSLGFFVLVINAVVAMTFLVAAIGKIVSPVPTRDALREVLPSKLPDLPRLPVRLFAIFELLALVLLIISASRLLGAIVVALIGLVFVAAGALGKARGATQSCGCFGTFVDKPLGIRNMIIGLGLLVAATINTSTSPHPLSASAYTYDMLVFSAFLALLFCMWLNRTSILALVTSFRSSGQ